MSSYFSLFRNYANFAGVMKRKPYWTALLVHCLILLIPLIPGAFYLMGKSNLLPEPFDLGVQNSLISSVYIPWVLPLWGFYFLLMTIPAWSASVRRLHTLPRSGWWLLVGVIPLAGWYLVLSWLLQKGNYAEYMWRLKKAGPATYEEIRRERERPRNGGWFFVVFAILAVPAWFLNQKMLSYGSVNKALAAIEVKGVSFLTALNTVPAETPVPEQSGVLQITESIIIYKRDSSFDPTFTPTPTLEPTPTPVPTRTIPENIEIN